MLSVLGAILVMVSLGTCASIGHKMDTVSRASSLSVTATEHQVAHPVELHLFPTSTHRDIYSHPARQLQQQERLGEVSKDWLSLGHADSSLPSSSGVQRSVGTTSHHSEQHDEQHEDSRQDSHEEQLGGQQEEAGQDGVVDNQMSFLREYYRLNLGSIDDAKELAMKVRGMKRSGKVTPQVIGKWAKEQLTRDRGRDFGAKYKQEARNLSNRLSQFKVYQPKRKAVVMDNAFEHLQKWDKQKAALSRRIPRPFEQARIDRVAATTWQAGQVFEKHFASKKMDLDKMSVEDIEEEARKVQPPTEMGKSQFHRAVNRYLEEFRPKINLDRLRDLRDQHRHKMYHAMKKQEQHM